MKFSKINKLISEAIYDNESTIKYADDKCYGVDIIQCNLGIIFYIPSEFFLFNVSKKQEVHTFWEGETDEVLDNLVDVHITNQVIIYDRQEYIKFALPKNEHEYIWVNRKDLQYFEAYANFKMTKNKMELLIYESDVLVGRTQANLRIEKKKNED